MSEMLHHIEWDHPRLGRINETVCSVHESDVIRALRTLGIGCGGQVEQDRTATCKRCIADVPPRVWLREEYAQ